VKRGVPEPMARFVVESGERMQADSTHVRRAGDPLLAFVPTLEVIKSGVGGFAPTIGED
jgi:hypothetical protein